MKQQMIQHLLMHQQHQQHKMKVLPRIQSVQAVIAIAVVVVVVAVHQPRSQRAISILMIPIVTIRILATSHMKMRAKMLVRHIADVAAAVRAVKVSPQVRPLMKMA